MSRHSRDVADQLPWFMDQLARVQNESSGTGRHARLDAELPTRALEARAAIGSSPSTGSPGRHALASKGSGARAEQHTVGAGRRMARVARRPLFIGVASALCFVVAGGAAVGTFGSAGESGSAAAPPAKQVSIMIDGKVRKVSTQSDTVQGALVSAGLTAGPHDIVAPRAGSAIADGSVIVVDRGRPFTVDIDGHRKSIWTTADTVADALSEAGVAQPAGGVQLDLSASPSAALPDAGLTVSGHTLRTVSWSIGGEPASSGATSVRTVRALLAEKDVVLGPLDRVSPSASTVLTPGMKVVVTRVSMTNTTARLSVKEPAATEIKDPTLEKGKTKIVRPGKAGLQAITYRVISVNGRPVTKSEIGRATVVAASPAVIHVGTKVPDPGSQQAADAAAAKFTYRGAQVFTNDTTFGVDWDGLAFCESTHNPKAVNANPSAGLPTYGMFQFDIPTWESVGGSGNPMDASPSEQLMRAKKLYQQRGLEPWACRDAADAPAPDAP